MSLSTLWKTPEVIGRRRVLSPILKETHLVIPKRGVLSSRGLRACPERAPATERGTGVHNQNPLVPQVRVRPLDANLGHIRNEKNPRTKKRNGCPISRGLREKWGFSPAPYLFSKGRLIPARN